jgi:hypothetical protein
MGDLEVVICLVRELGADVNQTTSIGVTPLYIAAQKGYLPVVQCLVNELGAHVDQSKFNGTTPLYIAVERGHLDVLAQILTKWNRMESHSCTSLPR